MSTVAGAQVTTRQLMVKMGQVKKGSKESDTSGKSDISKFQNYVCVMRRSYLLTGLMILSISATVTVKGDKKKGKGGGGKRKVGGSSNEYPPKWLNIEVADNRNKSFVVWVRGDAAFGSLFRLFQGLEQYSQLLKWIAKARPKDLFTLQTIYRCQLSEEAAQDARVMVGEEFCGSVWNQKIWNGEVQNFSAVGPEAATLLLEANLWDGDGEDLPENVLLVEESKKSNDGEEGAPPQRPKRKSPRTPGVPLDTLSKMRAPAQLDNYIDLPVPPTPSTLATRGRKLRVSKF
ncbi:hypothetical protein K440DRAFT_641617 [Wilcoxina mikolae CBS 423.85]|nr:hypothetical protein K440DRAFT_641617 [Wilcoxina mikolae CBS 423.85]